MLGRAKKVGHDFYEFFQTEDQHGHGKRRPFQKTLSTALMT